MIVKLIIDGGDMKPNASISQKLGPMGINIGRVIADVNKASSGFKGIKVPVELDVNPKTKSFTVTVSSPPTSELLKKELGLELGSGQAKKIKAGNLAIEQVIKIALTKHPSMTASSLKAAVKSVVGSCISSGILIENKEAKQVSQDIDAGIYDSEINSEKQEASSEKKKQLEEYFNKVKTKQDLELKKEEELKAAEEAAKAAATPGAATPATGTATATTTPEAEKETKTSLQKFRSRKIY